ncbi:MAG: para-nitrobenzyl esterase [Actinomycetota bacterium]|nr:para-nitrobenzyl esterase [Actinomycetota bacterium]
MAFGVGVANGPHPVLVWIFGGGEIKGSPSDPLYDGWKLAARGIVVVNVTYRLGSLGFLKVDHPLGAEYAGAEINALLDIAAALAWVQAEIVAFGGDPDRVTIAGDEGLADELPTRSPTRRYSHGCPALDGLLQAAGWSARGSYRMTGCPCSAGPCAVPRG